MFRLIKKSFVYFCILLCYSCSDVYSVLHGGNYRYWSVGVYHEKNTIYRFDSSGSFSKYEYDPFIGHYEYVDDVFFNMKWDMPNASTLICGERCYKIEDFSQKRIIRSTKAKKDTLFVVDSSEVFRNQPLGASRYKTGEFFCGKRNKYWINKTENEERCFYFDTSGKWVEYAKYDDGNFKRNKPLYYCPEKWRMVDENSLWIGMDLYQVIHIDNSRFIIRRQTCDDIIFENINIEKNDTFYSVKESQVQSMLNIYPHLRHSK